MHSFEKQTKGSLSFNQGFSETYLISAALALSYPQLYCQIDESALDVNKNHFLFSSTKGRKINTKVGLHTTTDLPTTTTQTFRVLQKDLGKRNLGFNLI